MKKKIEYMYLLCLSESMIFRYPKKMVLACKTPFHNEFNEKTKRLELADHFLQFDHFPTEEEYFASLKKYHKQSSI